MNLHVIGNGGTGMKSPGRHYINANTGKFLAVLARRGVSVTFSEPSVVYHRNSNLHDYCLEEHGVAVSTLRRDLKFGAIDFLRVMVQVLRADFVYIFFPGTVGRIVALLLAVFPRKHFGLYVRGENFNTGVRDRFIIRSASFCLTVAPTIAITLKAFCKQVDMIRPMIPFTAADAIRPEKTSEINAPSPLRMLFVGRVEERKGILELIAASNTLLRVGVEHRLCIVGGGPLVNVLASQIQSGQLPQVELTGQIADTVKLFSKYVESDIFVLPSHDEGFPRTLFEAMLAGLPVFVTMVGGIPGTMRPGENCVEVPVSNPPGIVETILAQLADWAMLQRIAYAGQQTALQVMNDRQPHDEQLMRYIYGEH